MSRSPLLLLAVAVFGLAVIGCEPTPTPKQHPSVAPRTTAPPGAVSEYTEDAPEEHRSIRLTEGVAMALECYDSHGAPCALDGTAIADDGVASFRRAYGDLDQTVVSGRHSATQRAYLNRSLFVVIGHHAGNTTLTLQTGEGPIAINVQVFAAQ
jgi:hypothetical protein